MLEGHHSTSMGLLLSVVSVRVIPEPKIRQRLTNLHAFLVILNKMFAKVG